MNTTCMDDVLDDDVGMKESISKWMSEAGNDIAKYPNGENFFLAECYVKSECFEIEPLLMALISSDKYKGRPLLQDLASKHLTTSSILEVIDSRGRIGFRFFTTSFPFLFAEKVLAPLCRDPQTSLFTVFVNAKKKGYAEKRGRERSGDVMSTAYWGMKRNANLPMQLWAYDLTQCDAELDQQTYSRNIYPLLSDKHLVDYTKHGRITEEKDYQFFLNGSFSYVDIGRSWFKVNELEQDWEALNQKVGTQYNGEGVW